MDDTKVWVETTKSPDLFTTWSHEKWETLYLHFRNTYGPQTWQGGNLGWEPKPPSLKTTWLLDKLKALYPHLPKTYGNQTWQGGDLGWWTWSLHF